MWLLCSLTILSTSAGLTYAGKVKHVFRTGLFVGNVLLKLWWYFIFGVHKNWFKGVGSFEDDHRPGTYGTEMKIFILTSKSVSGFTVGIVGFFSKSVMIQSGWLFFSRITLALITTLRCILFGLQSRDAYFKCIEKGPNLILNQAIEIAQNEEATSSHVSYMWQKFGCNTSWVTVNKISGKGGGANNRTNQNKGSKREVSPTRNRGIQGRNPVITVEYTIVLYADQRARMSKSMRYNHSQQQHSTRTAFQKSK